MKSEIYILEKCSNDYQLKDSELVLNEIRSSSYYDKFKKTKQKKKILGKSLKKKAKNWKMLILN